MFISSFVVLSHYNSILLCFFLDILCINYCCMYAFVMLCYVYLLKINFRLCTSFLNCYLQLWALYTHGVFLRDTKQFNFLAVCNNWMKFRDECSHCITKETKKYYIHKSKSYIKELAYDFVSTLIAWWPGNFVLSFSDANFANDYFWRSFWP